MNSKKDKKEKGKKENFKEEIKKEIREYDGVISVYLCLMLAVMISIILVMIEGARVCAMRVQLECATDLAMDSCLSEYHRELFDRYGVLFIDETYSGRYGSGYNLSDRLDYYMTYNLSPAKGLLLEYGSRDLLGLSTDSIDILGISRATDNKGEVFKYAANTYMLEKYGIGYIDNAKNLITVTDNNHLLEGDIIAANENAQSALSNYKYPDIEGVDWDEVDRSNPTDAVNELRGKGILSLVYDDNISTKGFINPEYVSHRNLYSGDGLNAEWDKRNDLETELLFTEYILLNCGCFTDVRDDSYLDYQVEYIIAGKQNDTDNMKDVVMRLFLLRGASNTIYFFQDEELKNEAKIIAEGLAIITLCPDLESLFETAIIMAWIFMETVYDVRTLLNGGKIPLIKSKGDWNTSLDKALTSNMGTLKGDKGNSNNKGQSYKDYMRILLYATDKDRRTVRCMDIVEMDIRKITGNADFSLDRCISTFNMQIIASSRYGYSFLMQRKASYW